MHMCEWFTFTELILYRPSTVVGEVYSFWPFSVYWCMMTGLYFHATGHEPTIPSIKFDAAFVGMHGEVESFVVAGILVAMNMLTSQVCVCVCVCVCFGVLCVYVF